LRGQLARAYAHIDELTETIRRQAKEAVAEEKKATPRMAAGMATLFGKSTPDGYHAGIDLDRMAADILRAVRDKGSVTVQDAVWAQHPGGESDHHAARMRLLFRGATEDGVLAANRALLMQMTVVGILKVE